MSKKKVAAGRAFAGIPKTVMDHQDYRTLPANAVRLLMAVLYHLGPSNNGDLAAAQALMRPFGFVSKETLHHALQALLQNGLLVQTRQGQFTNPGGMCSLYAITWRGIDKCEGKRLDRAPTAKPLRDWTDPRTWQEQQHR